MQTEGWHADSKTGLACRQYIRAGTCHCVRKEVLITFGTYVFVSDHPPIIAAYRSQKYPSLHTAIYSLIHNHRYIRCNIQSHTQPSLHTLQYTVSYTTIAAYATIYSLIHNHRYIRYNIQSHTQPIYRSQKQIRFHRHHFSVHNQIHPILTRLWDWCVGLTCWTGVLVWRVGLAVGLACWTGYGTDMLD